MKGLPAIVIGLTAYFTIGVLAGRAQIMYAPEPSAAGTPPPGVIETYKVVNGMSIRATVYNPGDGNTHRVAIVIHGGVFNSGDMETSIAQELSQYGFMGVAIEYRLAPPHTEMNTPAHPFPGQNDIGDDGHYPEQTDDVRDAIVHYRNDPRSNGEVVLIGGSAGASHSLYLAATGTPGFDMPDLAVLLSCAASNLADPNEWALECIGGEGCPHNGIANYLNIADPAPNPPVGNDLVLAQEASPTHWMHVGMCPFWTMCSNKDSLGIPTSTGFNINSYLPNNTPGVLENGENGVVPTALAMGLTESTSTEPETNSFKATIVPVHVWSHSFDYWDQVKSDVIQWINSPIPPLPTPTASPSISPTPTATASATPTATISATPTPTASVTPTATTTASPTTTPRPTPTPRDPPGPKPYPTPPPRP
jgi:pimeloyl-ACP methyl ester carboxylesterase